MRDLKRLQATLVLFVFLAGFAAGGTALADETRTSNTTQGLAAEADRSLTTDEYAALKTEGDRLKSPRSVEQQQAAGIAPPPPDTDFWIYDATIDLYADVDRDGYYSGIELTFDADTIYAVADVYAVVYLSYDYGPWNEYAVTEDFTILGTSGLDEYVIESDLVSGYPTGDYDVLIELFDAFDNTFVASLGPEDTSQLSLLPLEDMNRDAVTETRITVNSGGGGSLGWLLLLGLAVAAIRRR